MSKYTTEVRFICENAVGLVDSEGYKSVNDIITQALPKVFDFDFPIFDENYRSVLERKILKHFYTREICEETVGLWKLRLDTRLNEIMPYYNKLYDSELLAFDPFMDTNYKRTSKKDTVGKVVDDGDSTSNSTRTDDLTSVVDDEYSNLRTDNLTSTRRDNLTGTRTDNLHETGSNSSTDKYSDTPQGGLTGLINDNYLTNARMISGSNSTNNTGTQTTENTGTQTIENTGTQKNEGDSTRINTNTGTQKNDNVSTNNNVRDITNTDDYVEMVVGKVNTTSYSKLLTEFRETLLNIDVMIIDNLEDLFIQLW